MQRVAGLRPILVSGIAGKNVLVTSGEHKEKKGDGYL